MLAELSEEQRVEEEEHEVGETLEDPVRETQRDRQPGSSAHEVSQSACIYRSQHAYYSDIVRQDISYPAIEHVCWTLREGPHLSLATDRLRTSFTPFA